MRARSGQHAVLWPRANEKSEANQQALGASARHFSLGETVEREGTRMVYDSLKVELFELEDHSVEGGDAVAYDLPDYATFIPKLKRAIRRCSPRLPLLSAACPFCQTRLQNASKCLAGSAGIDGLDDVDEDESRIGALEVCRRCTYWRWHHLSTKVYGSRGLMATHEYRSHAGKLAEFPAALPPGCAEELAIHLRRRPSLWNAISPFRLETFVAEIMRANFQPVEVSHVGRIGDGGVDVVCIEADDRRWLIQVKGRLHASKGESVETIRNLLGAMHLEGSSYGAVVSTADHFTHVAHQAVGAAASKGSTVRLVDRSTLDRLLAPLLPCQPWAAMLRVEYTAFLPEFVRQDDGLETPNRQLELFPSSSRNLRKSRHGLNTLGARCDCVRCR